MTIHIGGFLKYTLSSQKKYEKVYLVCDEGVVVSRLLLKQCKLYFPNEQIDTVFTTEQFKSVEDIAQVDVVITTNDDLDSRFPILRVNPILEAEDILKMLDYLKHNIFRNESKSFSENLSSLISSYIVDSKLASKFQEEVQTFINQEIVVQAFFGRYLKDSPMMNTNLCFSWSFSVLKGGILISKITIISKGGNICQTSKKLQESHGF